MCRRAFATFGYEGRQEGRQHPGVGIHSSVFLLIANQLAFVRASVPLTQEVLSNGLQLCQLQPDLLQVVGSPVPDLAQGEGVQIPKGDAGQLPGGQRAADRRQQSSEHCLDTEKGGGMCAGDGGTPSWELRHSELRTHFDLILHLYAGSNGGVV